jgi:hypothetical protein
VVHGRWRVGKTELLARFAVVRPVAFFVAAQQQAVNSSPISAGHSARWRPAFVAVGRPVSRFRTGMRPWRSWPRPRHAAPRWTRSRRTPVPVRRGPVAPVDRPALVGCDGFATERRPRSLRFGAGDDAPTHVSRWGTVRAADALALASAVRLLPRRALRDALVPRGSHPGVRGRRRHPRLPRRVRRKPLPPRRNQRLSFSPDGRLFREAPNLLRSEFTEPRTYESVLRAMATGGTSRRESQGCPG